MEDTLLGSPRRTPATPPKRSRRTTPHEPHSPTHDEIAHRAHELYEMSGYQDGRDVEFWLEAERQLSRRAKS